MVRTQANSTCSNQHLETLAQEIKSVLRCKDVKRTGLTGREKLMEMNVEKLDHSELVLFKVVR